MTTSVLGSAPVLPARNSEQRQRAFTQTSRPVSQEPSGTRIYLLYVSSSVIHIYFWKTQQDHLRIKCGWRDNLLLDAREVLLSTANPSKASRKTLVRPWPFALPLPFYVDNMFESRQAKCSSVSRRRSSHHVHVYLLVFLCSAQEAPNGYV